jgi:hypothetical protein
MTARVEGVVLFTASDFSTRYEGALFANIDDLRNARFANAVRLEIPDSLALEMKSKMLFKSLSKQSVTVYGTLRCDSSDEVSIILDRIEKTNSENQ